MVYDKEHDIYTDDTDKEIKIKRVPWHWILISLIIIILIAAFIFKQEVVVAVVMQIVYGN